jgi:galactose mutarotase-like enzyme
MLHTIENSNLICIIESKGAEIRSLVNKITGEEYIWQIDGKVWGSSSPVLFPAIGKIKESKIVFEGKEYAMSKHGIVRNNDQLNFKSIDDSACSFTLNSSSDTLKKYPCEFSFIVSFKILENRLVMNYSVENLDSIPMHFGCGGHTAYACPISEETKLSDYSIEFPTQQPLMANTLGDTGLLSHQLRKIESQAGLLALSDTLFNQDALIFSNINWDWVRLRKKNQTKGIKVRFKGYPNLALWSKPGADYVCIEPWLGLPDHEDESLDLSKKLTLKTIAPNEVFSIAIETKIE